MISKIKNFTPQGCQLFVPYLKRVLVEDGGKTLSPIDGYQVAVLSLNLHTFLTLISPETNSDIPDDKDGTNQKFVKDFELILKDQADVMEKAYKYFREEFATELERQLSQDDEKELDHHLGKVYVDPSFRF